MNTRQTVKELSSVEVTRRAGGEVCEGPSARLGGGGRVRVRDQ